MTESNKVGEKRQNLSEKCHNIVKKRYKDVNLGDKKPQTSEKSDKLVKKSDERSQTSEKELQKCKFKW